MPRASKMLINPLPEADLYFAKLSNRMSWEECVWNPTPDKLAIGWNCNLASPTNTFAGLSFSMLEIIREPMPATATPGP